MTPCLSKNTVLKEDDFVKHKNNECSLFILDVELNYQRSKKNSTNAAKIYGNRSREANYSAPVSIRGLVDREENPQKKQEI